ncbi:MAG: ubiquinone biosynthesis hydroxylase [Nitratireductor sp.]|nr:ubiquinone biosynthesis hydroxylase [Nitratireductor sp.]
MAVRPASKRSSRAAPDARYDIVIAGGGYVGLCVAVAVAEQSPHLKILVAEFADEAALESDERASAIAAAATRMLKALGIWSMIEADAQPINEMIITDSKLADVTRPVFLTFAGTAEKSQAGEGEPFAHMVPNRSLVRALRERARALGVTQLYRTGVAGFSQDAAAMAIELTDGSRTSARLLVAADGVRSKLRDAAGIKTVHWPYDQFGIVTTVAHERDHQDRAEEHFLPAGPFAVLPLKGRRSSLVWTENRRDTERLMALDDFSFELELERRFGHKLGEVSLAGPRKAFPLGLTLARETVKDRFALVGDAAHGIHPISGQGLNLGFKDAAALAETLVEADRLGLDIGSLAVLERYQMWRRFDTVRMGVVTDVLNRLFSNDNPLLRIARDIGLGLVDRMPGLKQAFIDQAAGNQPANGDGSPRLLRGEPI